MNTETTHRGFLARNGCKVPTRQSTRSGGCEQGWGEWRSPLPLLPQIDASRSGWPRPITEVGASSFCREAYTRRMPRMQVYLPEELYRAVKERELPASELLQSAVRAELRRQQLLEETDRYLAELIDEAGEPSAKAIARAEALARRIRDEQPASRSA